MAQNKAKQILEDVIDNWINETQDSQSPLDLWISEGLAGRMADAAWAVIAESRETQEWLIRAGHMKRDAQSSAL